MIKANQTKKGGQFAKLHLLWIIPLCVIVGCGVLVGFIFLGIYLGTVGTVTNGGFCMGNSSCVPKTRLICVNSYCSCSTPYTWNSTNSTCANNTSSNSSSSASSSSSSSSTTTLTAIQKILLIFSNGSYTINTISDYGGTTFTTPTDIRFFETSSSISIYVVDTGRSIIALYNETGGFIKVATSISANYIQPVPTGNIYMSRVPNNQYLTMYDLNLNYIYQTSFSTTFVWNSYAIRYNPWTGFLYLCDTNGGYVSAFDLTLTRNTTESFCPLSLWNVHPIAIAFYQSAANLNYLILGVNQNRILIIQQSTKALVLTINYVCVNGYMYDIYCDPSGYFFVSCYSDKRIQLWYTNGTNTYRTGLYVPTAGNCYTVHTDSKGRLATALVSPNRYDIYTPTSYSSS